MYSIPVRIFSIRWRHISKDRYCETKYMSGHSDIIFSFCIRVITGSILLLLVI